MSRTFRMSRIVSRPRRAAVLLAGLATALGCAATTAAQAGPPSAHPPRPTRVAPAHTNPLRLRLPGGQQASSCADPSIVRGTGGDRHWYLYCTSDALTAAELGPDGTPLIHNVPMFDSLDLTHWTYLGDAFPTKPSWVKADAGMWAPDVVFRDGHYLMYYAAQDTNLPGGGSAVGVATSSSPAGPWHDTGSPVVPPTPSASDPNSRRWEFDPEVVRTAHASYIYFGSYFGGVFARRLTADGTGSLAGTEKQIAIDNRYEGTFIVRHRGWYYFMGSATNCCNGPLTGYAVFAARSRSPLGPFRDRDGRSILDSRVGGTPVLTQNGNRWVGTGHNAVFTDFSGQDWILYHAVDRNDPYYAGDVGYTKRPALIDPLDWRAGWPTVRGGRGPSDSPQPGPAAQPGQRTAYRPHPARNPRPGRVIAGLSDRFAGTALSPRWTWVRPPDTGSYSVADGTLRWQTQAGDLHPESASTPLASVLTEPAPRGDYAVETRVKVDVPKDGCCQNFVQGGLLVYGDDGNYVKLASVSIWNTRQTEFGKEITPQPAGFPNYGNTVDGPVGDWTYLRIVHRVRGGADNYTAYTSLDGRHWDAGGTWTHELGSATPKIGLVSMGGTGFTSTFDYVRVTRLR
jgi:arabinan endo-1,5-alpha-L-arabinosidase